MSHKLKALGLAFVAALAFSAVTATAASAEDHYRSPSAPTVGTGAQEGINVFTTEVGQITCNTAAFRGTQASELSNDLTATASFGGCTAFGLANTHISMNGCYFTFTTPAGGPTVFTAEPPHVICPETKVVTVTPTVFGSSVCTVTLPPQTPTSGGGTATNVSEEEGKLKSVTVTANVTGIHYTVDGGGGLCGATGGTKVDAKYEGSVLIKGYDDASSANDETHNNVRESIELLNT